jgi:excisionase family DNA binding protein
MSIHSVSKIRVFERTCQDSSCYTQDMESPRMLTVKQVADRLQIGQVTVLRWLRSGKLAGVKPGGTRIGWRVPVAEVERVERGE